MLLSVPKELSVLSVNIVCFFWPMLYKCGLLILLPLSKVMVTYTHLTSKFTLDK